MRFHIRAFDVADIARPESRQLFIRRRQEPECQFGLILQQGADAPIVGAAIIQEQIGHFLEGLALKRTDVLTVLLRVFKLAQKGFGIFLGSPDGVPVLLLWFRVVDDDVPPAALAGGSFFRGARLIMEGPSHDVVR